MPAEMMARIAVLRKLQQQAKKRSAQEPTKLPQEPPKLPAKRAWKKRAESGNAAGEGKAVGEGKASGEWESWVPMQRVGRRPRVGRLAICPPG